MTHSRIARFKSRGFTLIELLATVVIVAILAAAGVTIFRQRLEAAKGGEAAANIQAIRSAEESYRAENHVYLNVSGAGQAKPDAKPGDTNWYPQAVPGATRAAWVNQAHTDYPLWAQLAPPIRGAVRFSYLVNAGVSGTAIPKLQVVNGPTFDAVQTLDWYTIQARGDVDGNGTFATYVATSFNGEMYVENEGE